MAGITDVGGWLLNLGLGQYEAAFRENEIDAKILPSLTAEDLKDLGVLIVGHRRKLLDAIAALRDNGPVTAAFSTETSPASAPSRDSAERRQVTVMFADLVGSTARSVQMDPEDLREIIGAYQKCVTETARRFDGFVAKYMGDGVLIYFGYPQAHEDDAERAVRAGLAIRVEIGQLALGEPIKVRIGLATGLVVVGDLIGSGPSEERNVIGDTPNLAARLQALAEPNAIVIGDGTRRQVGQLFDMRDLGLYELKGFSEPQRAWQVLGESDIPSRFAALRSGATPLIGREEELEILLRRWGKAKRGEGRVVLVSAEPGIGKSRLTEEFLERVAFEQPITLRHYCSPHHQDSAFYPVIGQLERAAGFARGDAACTKRDKLAALLRDSDSAEKDLPIFGELLSLPGSRLASSVELPPQRKKELTLGALLRRLESLARKRPVIMLFEDLHWIDATTRELLDRVIALVESLPVLLIATFRPEFQPPWIGQAHVTVLALPRLNRRGGAALVRELIAQAVALPPNTVEEIVERSDGVPLFLEEITKVVLETAMLGEIAGKSQLRANAISVPPTLQASLLARLDRLGPASRELAQTGAAIGRNFSYELVTAVCQRDEAETTEALGRLVEIGARLPA